MKAVIYLRVSTKEQAEEGYSIPAQAEACRRFVVDQGWELADEYVDRGESARTADRPQLQAMLAYLADDPSIEVLVVHKLDRLARNLEDHAAIRAALRKAGVHLHSVTESLEDSASGKLVEGILASIAEFYSANLGQEIRKGMDQKAAQGGWPVRAPFGYVNVRRDGPGRRGESVLEPDPQAPLVVWAFERYATGELSLEALTGALAGKGLRNRLGTPPGKSAVHRMLRNPVYAGVVRWKGVEREGSHPPLINRELFAKVQSILDAHSTGGERSWKHDHHLKGILVCAECGSRLYYVVAKAGSTTSGVSGGTQVAPAAPRDDTSRPPSSSRQSRRSTKPSGSRRRSEGSSSRSSDPRWPNGSDTERRPPASSRRGSVNSLTSGRSSCAPTTPTPSTWRRSSASKPGSTRSWSRSSHSSQSTGRSSPRPSRSSTSRLT